MLNSLEEYLAGLSFEPPETQGDRHELDAGERAFVEKYLGIDTLEQMAIQNPEPMPLPALQPVEPASLPKWELKPEIIVAQPQLEIAPEAKTEIIVVPEAAPAKLEIATPDMEMAEQVVATAIEEPVQETLLTHTETQVETPAQARAVAENRLDAAADAPVETASVEKAAEIELQKTAGTETAVATEAVSAEISEREKLRQAEQIQVVSFFVSGQLFLLPVMGIQEVLRYMELVKVPQAPEFIAGAINLRGSVMPLIHLSALLTNSSAWTYDERSFIIVTGGQGMQMGLIIDKVSSMHMIPQEKIIWNVESKLGDAGEFLSALVDLDDKVCGMIAPDIIKQKLFAEF